MSAAAEPTVLHEIAHVFGAVDLSGCILTKLDEAAALGGALSVLIQRQLPVAYVSNGQRVPEDLELARAVRAVTLNASMASNLVREVRNLQRRGARRRRGPAVAEGVRLFEEAPAADVPAPSAPQPPAGTEEKRRDIAPEAAPAPKPADAQKPSAQANALTEPNQPSDTSTQ